MKKIFLMISLIFVCNSGSAKMVVAEARNVSVSIMKSPEVVYNYAADPENLPEWASGLSQSKLVKEGDSWIANSPMGKVKVKFTPKNSFGILDHDVTLPDGKIGHNPLRVVKNHNGSEVIFTVFRQEGMSDKNYETDVATVKKDLETLKKKLETNK